MRDPHTGLTLITGQKQTPMPTKAEAMTMVARELPALKAEVEKLRRSHALMRGRVEGAHRAYQWLTDFLMDYKLLDSTQFNEYMTAKSELFLSEQPHDASYGNKMMEIQQECFKEANGDPNKFDELMKARSEELNKAHSSDKLGRLELYRKHMLEGEEDNVINRNKGRKRYEEHMRLEQEQKSKVITPSQEGSAPEVPAQVQASV